MIKYVLLIFIILICCFKNIETFDTYNTCQNQGYPADFCTKSPRENQFCSCPAGQKLYKRYGICYCQTYN